MTDILFEIKAGFERGYVTANAIEMPEGGIVTRLVKGRLEVSNGIVCGDTKADILPIFVVERFGRSGEIGSGFIKGLGIKGELLPQALFRRAIMSLYRALTPRICFAL